MRGLFSLRMWITALNLLNSSIILKNVEKLNVLLYYMTKSHSSLRGNTLFVNRIDLHLLSLKLRKEP